MTIGLGTVEPHLYVIGVIKQEFVDGCANYIVQLAGFRQPGNLGEVDSVKYPDVPDRVHVSVEPAEFADAIEIKSYGECPFNVGDQVQVTLTVLRRNGKVQA